MPLLLKFPRLVTYDFFSELSFASFTRSFVLSPTLIKHQSPKFSKPLQTKTAACWSLHYFRSSDGGDFQSSASKIVVLRDIACRRYHRFLPLWSSKTNCSGRKPPVLTLALISHCGCSSVVQLDSDGLQIQRQSHRDSIGDGRRLGKCDIL